ncbi:CBS domain-containing protein, partial [Flavihumibacter sp. R14]|nr:CBS domain-containing protein [Flavihumibacter soli]
VSPATPVRDVLVEITKSRLGAVAVIENEQITGVITDGDIRRMMETHSSINNLKAHDIMGKMPKHIDKDELAVKALEIMRANNISQLLVTSENKYKGIVHLHDLLKEGII